MSSTRRHARAWRDLLGIARGAFGARGFDVFSSLLCGWVLAPGRRTVTAMMVAGDPEGRRCHDAYHRFVRCGRWSLDVLWRSLVVFMVDRLSPEGPIAVLI